MHALKADRQKATMIAGQRATIRAAKHGDPWTQEDDAFISSNYRKMTLVEMATALGRRFFATRVRVTKLGLGKELLWKPEEDAFLRRHKDKSRAWCAEKLKRSLTSVQGRVKKLGIQNTVLKGNRNRQHVESFLRLHSQGMTTYEIGREIGVTHECIRGQIKKRGLAPNPRNEKARVRTGQLKRRRFGKAALALQAESLGKLLSEAERSLPCKT